MQNTPEEKDLENTVETIVEAIRSKKGNRILDLDITKISTAIYRHFVICDAQSHIQVQSIAKEIEDEMQRQLNKKAYHKEGYQNGYWILLDYADVVVHIFQTEARSFYNLEELWGDGLIKKYES